MFACVFSLICGVVELYFNNKHILGGDLSLSDIVCGVHLCVCVCVERERERERLPIKGANWV